MGAGNEMSANLRIACAQTRPIPGDVAANVRSHARALDAAAAAGASVVVFPELSLTGYEIALGASLTFSPDDRRFDPLVGRPLTAVVGAPIRLGDDLHIGAIVLRADGGRDVYTKRRLGAFPDSARRDAIDGVLPPPERSAFVPGDRDPLVAIAGTHAALAVCADTGDPAHALAAADRGATIYLASMFLVPSEYAVEVGRLRGAARERAMVVAMANFGGPSGGLRAAGGSAVFDAAGEVVVRLGPRGAGIAVAERTGHGWLGRAIELEG